MIKEIQYPLQFIKGVGPKRAELLAEIGIKNLWDAIFNFPFSYIDRNSNTTIQSLKNELLKQTYITKYDFDNLPDLSIRNEHSMVVRVTAKREHNLSRGKKLLTLLCSDGSGESIKINFWNFTDFYKNKYSLGMYLIVSGKVIIGKNGLEISHPEIENITENERANIEKGEILPIYHLNEKLRKANVNLNLIRDIVRHALDIKKDQIFERMPKYIIEKFNLMDFSSSISKIHFPNSIDELKFAIDRIKFDEIFIYILKMKFDSSKVKVIAPKINSKSVSARKVFDELPFKLTSDQKKVLNQIAEDFETEIPMNRLLQGDVGSGKTITALLAMLMAFDSGYQTLIIAPTSVLAEQHFKNIQTICANIKNIKVEILTGSVKLKSKKKIIEAIKTGEINIILGTHALIQQNLTYNKLAFVVIDEQHRFGVAQRNNLKQLAKNSFSEPNISPHILVMSATPIPRTLSLTLYSNLNVSIIKELPVGRSKVITSIAFENRLDKIYNFIKKEVSKGRQAYIVFPLVEKSEKLDLKAAEEQFELLSHTVFKDINCGLLHGKLTPDEKYLVMEDFKANEVKLLFSTTVIEVGVDVPNATIMLIINAERFGLSQLHQLRGRVGRGKKQSFCILQTSNKYGFKVKKGLDKDSEKISAVKRLKTMEKTNDGFEIAESDMEIRGPGDMIGTKQSGIPDFKFLNLIKDKQLIENTKNFVDQILKEDPSLTLDKNSDAKAWLDRELKRSDNYVETA